MASFDEEVICDGPGQLTDDGRYLQVVVTDGEIVLHTEDREYANDTRLEVSEVLALIRTLTEALNKVI